MQTNFRAGNYFITVYCHGQTDHYAPWRIKTVSSRCDGVGRVLAVL